MKEYFKISIVTFPDKKLRRFMLTSFLRHNAYEKIQDNKDNILYDNILVDIDTSRDINVLHDFAFVNNSNDTVNDHNVKNAFIELLDKGLEDKRNTNFTNMNISNMLRTFPFTVVYHGIVNAEDVGVIYTDGSSHGSGGYPGGYCALKVNPNGKEDKLYSYFHESEVSYDIYSGSLTSTTNNRAEITGLITASKNITNEPKLWVLCCDNENAVNAFRNDYEIWRRDGWKNSQGKPVLNLDLYNELLDQIKHLNGEGVTVLGLWTKGHAKNPFNEMCDQIAKEEKAKV